MPLPHACGMAVLAACILVARTSSAQQVFINEIHYDNNSTDVGEFVEVAGPVGTDLSDYQLVFYNGANGTEYETVNLSGTIGVERVRSFPVAGIQNGSPDGIALFDIAGATLVQFLSYEGTFTANEGPANGETSVDIGVNETGNTPVGSSLQLIGSGETYDEFTWSVPSPDSPGSTNANQTFTGGANPLIILTFSPNRICEINGPNASTGTVTLIPAPASAMQIDLANPAPMEITIPSSVTVPISGVATFAVDARTDNEVDGVELVTVTGTDPTSQYESATADIVVTDADGFPGTGVAMRLATINVLDGVGAPGSDGFDALVQILNRIDPDVIALQEVTDDDDFRDLKDLALALGFGTSRTSVATVGDDFVGNSYSGGDFGSGQYTAFLSRWPILETVQIGRGIPNRKEITRFPPSFPTAD